MTPAETTESRAFPTGPLILALVGTFYALGAAPGLTWLDAGELAAASHELGVAHPPGLPLFSIINKFVTLLVPFGDVGFRGNLASGLVTALGLLLAVRCFKSRHAVATIGAAVLMGTTPLLVLHSTTVEVYAGVAALACVTVWSLAREREGNDRRWLVTAALVLGFAIGGHHAELRLLALLLLVPCALLSRSMGQAIAALIAGVWGTLIIAYLPIRSSLPLWRDWGDPSSGAALWDHFWGARIRAAYGQDMGTVDLAVFDKLWDQLALSAPLLAVLGLIGCVLAVRRTGGWLIPALLGIDLIYSLVINPMGVRDMQNGVLSVVALGMGAVVSLDEALNRWSSHTASVVVGLACLMGGALSFGGFATDDDRALSTLIHRVDDLAHPEAVTLVASDNLAAGLAFGQVVEGLRPDVAVVVRQHIQYSSSIEPVANRLPRALRGWRPGHALADLDVLTNGWPILWEWSGGSDAQHRPPDLVPKFPLFSRSTASHRVFESELNQWSKLHEHQAVRDPQLRRMIANLNTDIAQYRMGTDDSEGALKSFENAVKMRPHHSSVWTNLGTGLAANGQNKSAIDATIRALDLNPNNRVAQLNLGRFLILDRQWIRAIKVLRDLLEERPSADAYGLLGVALGNEGDLKAARDMFKKALQIDPEQPEAKSGLSQLTP